MSPERDGPEARNNMLNEILFSVFYMFLFDEPTTSNDNTGTMSLMLQVSLHV